MKEVYRDLLSSKDKEFDGGEKKDKRASAERVTIIDYPSPSSGGDGDSRPSQIKVGFDGALSLVRRRFRHPHRLSPTGHL